MMKRAGLLLALMLALPASLAIAAGAPPACELKVLTQDDGADISAGAWSATCVAGSGCAVLGPEVAGRRLQLARQVEDKRWQIVLNLPHEADAAAGMQIAIDDGAAENLPGEFTGARAKGRALFVRPEVALVVLDMLKGGKRQARWQYTLKNGEKQEARFSLQCFAPVLQAAERQLARMRAMKQLGK